MNNRIDGKVAFETTMKNAASKWPTRNDQNNRLSPRCMPEFRPSFHLDPGESIFTIGSCFARHVERALKDRGFQVPCLDFVAPQGETWGVAVSDILNKYTPHGMLNEVDFAFGGSSARPSRDYLIEGKPGEFMDYQLHVNKPVPLERALQRREEVAETFRLGIKNSRVAVITLGLIETWWDDEIGIYLNETPSPNMIGKYDGRFSFEVMSFSSSLAVIDRLVGTLREARGADLRVVMTVSPVPLQRTFTDSDVLSANMYSKSVLRAVAGEIATAYDFVDYFPSYESITMSDPAFSWKDDLAHVRQEAVDLNIGRMVDAYARTQVAA